MMDLTRNRTSNLNLQAIEVFCEVVKFRSFSKGAERLAISQSAASQQIANDMTFIITRKIQLILTNSLNV